MPVRLKPIGVGIIVAAVMIAVIGLSRPDVLESATVQTLQAKGQLKWYRGNMHTHSVWSDGDDYLESIALWYYERGYNFLVFTDHNVLANRERWEEIDKVRGGRVAYGKLKARFPKDWVDERISDEKEEIRFKRFDEVAAKLNQKDKFLLIQGEEISDKFDQYSIHMNATNLVEMIPPMGGSSVSEAIQNNVDALIAQRERTGRRMMIHLNHPNFGYGITAEDLAPIRGENFFEVYNGHPAVQNAGDAAHPSTDRMWDIINSLRLTEYDLPLLYGLACDDSHSYHTLPTIRASEPGRGWVMVLCDQLRPGALLRAMEAGRFYATTGVTLEKVVATKTELQIAIRPDPNTFYTIDFIGTRKGFDPSSQPVVDGAGDPKHITRRYSEQIGATLKTQLGTTATYTFTGDELYVRARITSSRPHANPMVNGEKERAWTQPVRP